MHACIDSLERISSGSRYHPMQLALNRMSTMTSLYL